MRLANESIACGYPREGYVLWMDSVAVLKDAQNPEAAKTSMNSTMEPETAAMISEVARYANGSSGS
ncbi:spermidine/putrescine transport system substrate-binding protein [Salipiger thiooxidans]|uniref:Spermidine/putrescine transport system substrate-binding protein n=1 Tax=Salipiger thiooxidans TaxID=282683 RepID=A0A1G7BID0_9RHOB|nr:spermidine/putrescine transport system substrate-binding protein [Salipiger thiooxidans]